MNFLEILRDRNSILFWFGLIHFVFAIAFLILSWITDVQVSGVNAWIKPFKFAVSIGLYSWTMGWFVYYLNEAAIQKWFSWNTVLFLGFEIVYISFQAARGQLSHFNVSTPFYSFMYSTMALAATIVTLWTAYVCYLFFIKTFPALPVQYVWAIRFSLIIFVIFSFEGFVMGSRMSHTIGGADGGVGLPILNWSTRFGDPRIAHFVGMHALQVLPLLGFYVFKDVRSVTIASAVYGLLAVYTLILALHGKPLIKL